ncbi:putative TonB-dependent receptor [Flavihumibacter petaseus NBRC 106054]|uniref:Putative TonB-dependent receptor n=2 Tax=Flavihumibacter TaxID=1004301 RepID=A0A0E9MZS8_9BACT|nr:putative TonB-dependent receptor [Flavihumibacter petaseus NBRC 106054]
MAQSPTYTGTVKDGAGKPISGVSVVVKGTSRGTTTDNNGRFSISAEAGSAIVLSSMGFENRELVLGKDTDLSVSLATLNQNLEDVIVVGYGTQKRTAVTGAISTLNSKTINEIPVVSVQSALQGRVPGVNVVGNGSPGTEPIVTIRGISSISYASNPLYVVDGFPTGDLSAIDTRDIESVDVLKDASAAAIYGSRATNGVIMITTKKGKREGKLRVDLNSYYGIQNVNNRLDILNPEQFDKYALAYRGSLVPRRTDPAWVNTPIYPGASTTYGNNVTDWQDEYFRQGSMTQTHIGLSGGNDASRFYASGSFFDQQGTAPGVAYRRYNFRINSDHRISKTFSFGENIYIAYGDQNYDNNETGTRSNLVNVIKMMPYMPVYDPTTNGGYRGVNSVLDGGDPTNPIEDAELKNPGNRTTVKVLGTIFAEVNLTSWLKFRSTFGVDYANGLDYRFSPIFNDGGTVAGSSAIQATVTNNRTLSAVQLYTQQFTFDKSFGNHHVNAIAVYEYQGQRVKNENASGNQPSNDLKTLNNASNISAQTLIADYNIVSYIGRVAYDYKGKYLVNAALRRDGGSYWAPGKKWQTFPSASVGWRIDQEEFMNNIDAISELKLRAGWGITGLNGAVLGSSPWQVYVNANSSYYPFGNALTSGPASSIQRLGNTNLEWETTEQTNIGLDLGLFHNSLTLSAEYYQRKTDNLIMAVPLSPSMGYLSSTVITNAAGMKNTGFEFQVGYSKRRGDFSYNATGIFSTIKNEVLKLADGVPNIEAGSDVDLTEGYNVTNTMAGEAVQSFYGWQTEGIFQTADEVLKHAKQTASTAPGDIKFKDLNNDGVIDNLDRTVLGSFIPKFTYSLNLGANYKGFGLTLFFQGVQGNKIYNALRTTTEGMVRFFNAGTRVLDAWTPTNTNTDVPRAISADPNQNARPSDRFLEDGSYFRLKNIMLNYNVPDRFLQSATKGVVKNFNIYISAQNLFTVTNYTGLDPEVGRRDPNASSLTNGIDYAVYPQPKGFQIGISTSF